MFADLRSFLDILRSRKELKTIDVEVSPHLEIAEIHRRVIAENGPALFFSRVQGSKFPVVTNLYGTKDRAELAFGVRGERFIEEIPTLIHELLPPSLSGIWQKKGVLSTLLTIGTKTSNRSAVSEVIEANPDLMSLPVITSWSEDGGPFLTLPLVYTEHPVTGVHNLGIYRMQRYSKDRTGLHMQIGKGGGFHLTAHKELGRPLPVNVFLGGPPAVTLAAIAPLPENVPELLFASLLLGKKIELTKCPLGSLPLLANAEFVLVGECDPEEREGEGPFGDHYGYYSLKHDFPVFRCRAIAHRRNPIYPATVVGKPRQEDYYIGNRLQEILSPLFPVVMPSVRKIWSYGETGYHSLAAAVVQERYKREALMSGFRILGEGQLSLTKFLLLIGEDVDLTNFRAVLTHILERARFETDLYLFPNTSMDTLDYGGPRINEGSKGLLIAMGDPVRVLPSEFKATAPTHLADIRAFSPGCLVIQGEPHSVNPRLAEEIAQLEAFKDWPLLVLADSARKTAESEASFLWSTFTRFNPATDVVGRERVVAGTQSGFATPIVIDSRMKGHYPAELECDDKTKSLVDRRWREYGIYGPSR